MGASHRTGMEIREGLLSRRGRSFPLGILVSDQRFLPPPDRFLPYEEGDDAKHLFVVTSDPPVSPSQDGYFEKTQSGTDSGKERPTSATPGVAGTGFPIGRSFTGRPTEARQMGLTAS